MHIIIHQIFIEPPRTLLLTELAKAVRLLGLRIVYRNWRLTVEPVP